MFTTKALLVVSCALCSALTLAGCELFRALVPQIAAEREPSPRLGHDNRPEGTRGKSLLPLAGGYVVSAKPPESGLKVIDVHDPRRPEVAATFDAPVYEGQLFRIGDHIVYRTRKVGLSYEGERDDVDLPKARASALINLDLSDPTRPVLANELPVPDAQQHSVLAGDALLIAQRSQIRRYELQDGLLVETGELDLDGEVWRLEAAGTRLLVASSYGSSASIAVVETGEPSLKLVSTVAPRNDSGRVEQLWLDGDDLRVLYRLQDDTFVSGLVVDTFDLAADPALGPRGRCALGARADIYSLDASLFASDSASLFVSNAGDSRELGRFDFDAAGNCPTQRSFGPNSRSYALNELSAQALATLGPSGVQLFDTSPSGASSALASVPLATGYLGGDAAKPLQAFALQRPLSSEDGATEPWLLAVMDRDQEPAGLFQLITASSHTLTPRSTIRERGIPEDFALYDDVLLTLSSTQLRAFDIRDVEAPRELGQLTLNESYYYSFRFGDYIARIRQSPWSGGSPDETALLNDLEIVPLAASDRPALASLPAETTGNWLATDDLLLNIRWQVTSWQERTIDFTVHAYDLTDPTHPRSAGTYNSATIHAEFDLNNYDVRLDYHTVGRALVLPQREQLPNARIHWCWKSIDHTVCPECDASGCTHEYYRGLVTCTTIDDGRETCEPHELEHCVGKDCRQATSYPQDATLEEVSCQDYEEPREGPASLLAVIDFRDADQPELVQPMFKLDGEDLSGLSWGIIENNKYYHTHRGPTGNQTRTIDFSDPQRLRVSAPHPVPGKLEAVTESDLYTSSDELTLYRVPWSDSLPPPAATRSWPSRSLLGLMPDHAGHLLLVHGPASQAPLDPTPRASWAHLEILDAQTLATLGTLELDVSAHIRGFLNGRLLISLAHDGLLFVDVRDAAHPKPQAAVPYSILTPLHTTADQIHILENGQARSYPIELQNLVE